MRWPPQRIVGHLVVVTLIVGTLTGLAGLALVQVLERRTLVEEATARNLASAERIAARIDDRLVAVREQLAMIASRRTIARLEDDAELELAVALRIATDLDALMLHDVDGQPVAAAAAAQVLRAEQLEGRAPADEQELDEESWIDRDGALPSLEMAVAVEDPPGIVVGTLIGEFPIALVAQEATTQTTATVGTLFLTDGSGRIRAHRESDRVIDGERFDLDVFAQGRATTITAVDERTVVAGSPLQTLDAWVVVEQQRGDIIQPADVALTGSTGVFLALIAAIVGAVILAGRRLLRPLGPLAEAVERVRRGDLRARVDTHGVGEAAVLARGFNGMAQSLQEREDRIRRAERSTRESEERLRLMIEGVRDYAIFLVGLDGTIRSWNRGGERLLGYQTDAALELPVAHIFRDEDETRDALAAASRSGSSRREGWCFRRDDSRFWAGTTVTALRDQEDTAPYGYAVILHDLTERRAAQTATDRALRREQAAASELRRTAEIKDEFLAIAAHEIRTPLSAILGATNVLATEWDELDRAEQRQFQAMIETAALDMRDIVERLLDFTRLQAGRVQVVSERFELRATLERHLRPLTRRIADHQLVMDAPSTEVHTDPEVLRHIVTNLVSNAATFSPTGSTITLTAEVGLQRLRLSVRDEGSGIAPEDHERIFELFRQSSHAGAPSSGAGVGLAIVKRYVELVGGQVVVDSAPGAGSTFRVSIPLTTTRIGAPATTL